MTENGELRIGVVGLGKMGLLHTSLLNAIPNARVSVICENKRIIARFARKIFAGVTIVDRIQDFSNLNLDAVVISTPIPSHSRVIEATYSAGVRNVFVEKTLSANSEDSLRICQLAQKAGGVNMVGYMARFAVTFQKARELLNSGSVGTPVSFAGYAFSADFVGIAEKSGLRGGVVRDLGCHIIDLALWYFGDFEVSTATLEPNQPIDSESSAIFKVKGSNGLAGEFNVSWCKAGYRIPDYGLTIRGTDGVLEVNNDMVTLTHSGKQKIWHRVDLNDNVPFLLGASEYYREDAAFIDAIIGKSHAEPDFAMASKVDCFIDQVKQAAVGTKQ